MLLKKMIYNDLSTSCGTRFQNKVQIHAMSLSSFLSAWPIRITRSREPSGTHNAIPDQVYRLFNRQSFGYLIMLLEIFYGSTSNRCCLPSYYVQIDVVSLQHPYFLPVQVVESEQRQVNSTLRFTFLKLEFNSLHVAVEPVVEFGIYHKQKYKKAGQYNKIPGKCQ